MKETRRIVVISPGADYELVKTLISNNIESDLYKILEVPLSEFVDCAGIKFNGKPSN